MKNDAQENLGLPQHQKQAPKNRERSKTKVTGNRNDGATFNTSVAMTSEEKNALASMSDRMNISKSDLIRRGIRMLLGSQSKKFIPASIGVVDGVYSATVHDDIVELSNMLSKLAYAVGILEQHITRTKRSHVRVLLRETISQLEVISGRVNAYQSHPI